MMNGFGMMGSTGLLGMTLWWLFIVAITAFIFGVIFWLTYKLIVNDKTIVKKKKQEVLKWKKQN